MIKKIQAETGARVQFQQQQEEGPGERRCYLSGAPKQVEQARQRIEELIDSVHRRDNEGPPGGRGRGRGGGGGGDRFDRGNRNGGQEYGGGGGGGGGWEDRRNQHQQHGGQEVTFMVPSSKCGVIIGRGGETIKQINQQSGAHCELDRKSQNQNSNEKTFIIRGDPESIETAKRIISDKVQLPLNFVSAGGPPMSNNMPTAYPGMAPQGYNPQSWGMPSYQQQQWNNPQQGGGASGAGGGGGGGDQPVAAAVVQQVAANVAAMQVNPSTGQPDYSLQWAEYYRSMGMHREAEVIEQQSQTNVQSVPGGAVAPAATQGGAGYQPQQQQAYGGAYQAPNAYYGGQPQAGVPGGAPQQGGYGGFPSYGYGAPGGGAPAAPTNPDN